MRALLLIYSLFLIPLSSGAALAVLDSTGSQIKLEEPARRIISLAPHTTELLFAAGAGQWVVGAVSYSDYPQAALKIPRIGGYQSLDFETIVRLKPDLIIAWKSGNSASAIEKLHKLGFPVFVTEARELEDIPALLAAISTLTATQQQGNRAVKQFNTHLSQLRQRYASVKKVKVFYQIWRQPLMTVNQDHLISKVIDLCGGINIFSGLTQLAGSVGIEGVLDRNPDVILINGQGERYQQWSADWWQWNQMTAVKNRHVFEINPDTMSRHSPRILLGADEVCSRLDSIR